MDLPIFKYHPNPINTRSIIESKDVCECCNKRRGYIYSGSMYSRNSPESICPWCIADGSAHEKFEIEFASISPAVIDPKNPVKIDCRESALDELLHRTPGFSSYQEIEWPNHCKDFCEYHGMATVGDLKKISEEGKKRLFNDSGMDDEDLYSYQEVNDNEGLHYLLKFVCSKCGELLFQVDPD